jgi:hypothetical protein
MSKETPTTVTLDTIENATRATLREFLTGHDVAYRAKDTLAVLRLAALAVLTTTADTPPEQDTPAAEDTTPDTVIVCADGNTVRPGDRAFNYYDRRWVTVGSDIDADGWVTCTADDGRTNALNGERLSTSDPYGTTVDTHTADAADQDTPAADVEQQDDSATDAPAGAPLYAMPLTATTPDQLVAMVDTVRQEAAAVKQAAKDGTDRPATPATDYVRSLPQAVSDAAIRVWRGPGSDSDRATLAAAFENGEPGADRSPMNKRHVTPFGRTTPIGRFRCRKDETVGVLFLVDAADDVPLADAPWVTDDSGSRVSFQRCDGECGAERPLNKYPTVTGKLTYAGYRDSECRSCRDARVPRNNRPTAEPAPAAAPVAAIPAAPEPPAAEDSTTTDDAPSTAPTKRGRTRRTKRTKRNAA